MTNHANAGEPNADEISREVEFIAAQRLIFFSDAVVAIAITLLALGLPVPHGATNSRVLHSMSSDGSDYLAFLISFAVISTHWRAHHRLFRNVARLDTRVIALDMLWLLMIVITPFATRVLSGAGGFGVRFTFYAVIQIIIVLTFLVMSRHISSYRLLREGAPAPSTTSYEIGLLTVVTMFAISIPLAFVTQWAFVCWVASPLVARTVRRQLRREPGDRAG
jgi:uncharacterized membrane protein